MQTRLMPWSRLRREQIAILRTVYRQWRALLDDRSLDEGAYRKFLAEHAGFFLHTNRAVLAISELRLGADHRVDLVRTRDRGSYGFQYDLIELESPHQQPFNKSGVPSKGLNWAMQQIRDWRRWLKECRNEAKWLFPAKIFTLYDRECFDFTIVIGRRSNKKIDLDKRNQLSAAENVQIRSYDYLTELLQKRIFSEDLLLCSSEADQLGSRERNELVNPFAEAMRDAEWRRFLKAQPDIAHMYANNARLILEMRRYNRLLRRFERATADVTEKAVRNCFYDQLVLKWKK